MRSRISLSQGLKREELRFSVKYNGLLQKEQSLEAGGAQLQIEDLIGRDEEDFIQNFK